MVPQLFSRRVPNEKSRLYLKTRGLSSQPGSRSRPWSWGYPLVTSTSASPREKAIDRFMVTTILGQWGLTLDQIVERAPASRIF